VTSPDKREAHRDTLRYALAIAGSERELARQLRATLPQLERWLSGADDIPDRIFLAAVDVVIDSSQEAIWRSRGLLARSR